VSLSELKLMPPSTALPLMSRSQILERLASEGEFKINLLRAPAGYGKTSLLRMIYACANQSGQQAAWLTLDGSDVDQIRLMLGLRAALKLSSTPAPDNFAPLQQSQCTHLFLDDVERLDTPAIELLFSLILQGSPPGLRVFLGARSLHGFSTAGLKAKGVLRELDMQDLQFTHDETVSYLHHAKLDLQRDELALLQHASEGWPAAVELIALAWRRRQGRTQPALPSLHSLHDLGEYLANEVFEAQSATVQDFLVATTPLASFNAALADAARSAADSAALIDTVRAAGLPIQPLQGGWFRYHPLFAEHVVLRHRPAPALYLRTAEWLSAHDHKLESFDYFVKANRVERATDTLESIMLQLRSSGQIATVVQMADQLPPDIVQSRPALAATVVAGMVYTGRHRELAERLELCRRSSEQPFADPHYSEVVRGLDPTCAFLNGDFEEATRLIAHNWPLQQNANALDRSALTYINVYACLWRGDLDEAAALMILARRDCGITRSLMGVGIVHFLQAYLDAIQGDLRAADRGLAALEQVASQYGEEVPPMLLHLFGGGLMLLVKYELNQLDTIKLRLQAVDGIILFGLPWESHISILLIHSRMIALQQGPNAARQWLEAQIVGAGRAQQLPAPARRVLESELARLSSQHDAPGVAVGYARLLGNGEGQESYLVPCTEIDGGGIAQARLLIYTAQPEAAAERLRQLLAHALRHRRVWRATRLQLLLAIALERCGRQQEAAPVLAAALAQGAQSGLIRCFLDEGEPALALLRGLQGRARHVLSAAAMSHLEHLLSLQDVPAPASPLYEELTQTEAALLTMVAHGKTNKEVGDALFLSVNTVKWHMGQIFRKLDASNRSQAVFNARQAGLLPKQ
jgi:LuxR family maltose regulon positive regulatory protein